MFCLLFDSSFYVLEQCSLSRNPDFADGIPVPLCARKCAVLLAQPFPCGETFVPCKGNACAMLRKHLCHAKGTDVPLAQILLQTFG